MVDDGRIAFTPAVELSYLIPEEQNMLLSEMGMAIVLQIYLRHSV